MDGIEAVNVSGKKKYLDTRGRFLNNSVNWIDNELLWYSDLLSLSVRETGYDAPKNRKKIVYFLSFEFNLCRTFFT